MPLPPLYKYLSLEGARLTLGNGTFRHAKPSDFNDDMDMTLQSVFPGDIEAALEEMTAGTAQIISDNLDKVPTASSPELRQTVQLMQQIFRENPDAVEVIEKELASDSAEDIYDVEHMRAFSGGFVGELNDFLQQYRVLCVSDNNASKVMWERYAEDHCGIVLRVKPNEEKDSKFQLFRKVTYERDRPTLYESTRAFREDALFGNQSEIRREMLNKIIYSKTLEWAYEQEYRLAIPLAPGEDYDTLPYHPEELSDMFLGAKMVGAEKEEITDLARARNPGIRIHEAHLADSGELAFREKI